MSNPSIEETLETYWRAKKQKEEKKYGRDIQPTHILSSICDYVNAHFNNVLASVRRDSLDDIDRLVLTFPQGVSWQRVVEVKNAVKEYAATDQGLAGSSAFQITLTDEQIATTTARTRDVEALKKSGNTRLGNFSAGDNTNISR